MKFAVVDLSKSISSADLYAYANAQQIQLRQHYASAYDGDGDNDEVRVASSLDDIRPGEVAIRLRVLGAAASGGNAGDDAALAEHGIDNWGVPVCDVYLDLLEKYSQAWQPAASHEVLEARADPRLHACIELDDGSIFDKEICDRVESDEYDVDGVPLSNFNTPACFEPVGAPDERFDWLGLSTHANEVRPGGYAQTYMIGSGWQIIGQMRGYRRELAELGLSRGARRKARSA
jgi:hypothetical protein